MKSSFCAVSKRWDRDTKAEWLRQQYFPETPEFPLDNEVLAAIPKHLPGDVPNDLDELYGITPARQRRRSKRADDEVVCPERDE